MKKKLIIIVIICLSLFIFRNSIIRQYFISKIEYVDYDEYILIDYLNDKKNKASYVGADFMVVLGYNEKEEVEHIVEYDYNKMLQHQYNVLEDGGDKDGNNGDRPLNLNNEQLLVLLKSKKRLSYKGIEKVIGRDVYVLKFDFKQNNVITIYLDKDLLYTVRYEEKYAKQNTDSNIINDYELDLELKHKDLFKEYIN